MHSLTMNSAHAGAVQASAFLRASMSLPAARSNCVCSYAAAHSCLASARASPPARSRPATTAIPENLACPLVMTVYPYMHSGFGW